MPDIDREGLTWEHVDAWLEAQPGKGGDFSPKDGRPIYSWRRSVTLDGTPQWHWGPRQLHVQRWMGLRGALEVICGVANDCSMRSLTSFKRLI